MDNSIRALCFDVFGTVVDWRGSIIAEGDAFNREFGWSVDWAVFADAWRGLYQPSMEEVRSDRRPWVNLDTLHRESLEKLLDEYSLPRPPEDRLNHLNHVWHRLAPWPDVVAGMTRLKTRYILATLSNGNVALLVEMARRAGLPWDAILGAEVAKQYKVRAEPYLVTAEMLGLTPDECLMVAAHNADLSRARELGFRTAFVSRPMEHGPGQSLDIEATADYDFDVRDLIELADALGCGSVS